MQNETEARRESWKRMAPGRCHELAAVPWLQHLPHMQQSNLLALHHAQLAVNPMER